MQKAKFARRTRFAAQHKEMIYDRLRSIETELRVLDLRDGWSPEHTLPHHIVEAAKKVLESGPRYRYFETHKVNEAIASKIDRENGIDVDPNEEILVTTGGAEAMFLAIWTLIDPGDEVIMTNPGYVGGYEPSVLMAGGRMAYVSAKEEKRFKIDPDEVEAKITKKTKMIIIVTPDNPTGTLVERSDLDAIAEIARENDLIVISDEIFEKLVYDGKKNASIAAIPGMRDRTFVINGFSKGYNMPGFRVGYIAGPKPFIEKMANIQFHITVSVNDMALAAVLATLNGPQKWIEDAIKDYGARRVELVDGLNRISGINCLKPEGGFAAFVNMKEFGMSSFEMVNYLLTKARVKTGPGFPYYGANAEGYIKIGFCRPQKSIELALERIQTALEML